MLSSPVSNCLNFHDTRCECHQKSFHAVPKLIFYLRNYAADFEIFCCLRRKVWGRIGFNVGWARTAPSLRAAEKQLLDYFAWSP